MNLHVFLLVCLLIVSLVLLCAHGFPHQGPLPSKAAAKIRSRLSRQLKPRCPDDCPACRLTSTPSSAVVPAPLPVRPWSEVKSRRGTPKRIETAGFACPNPQCQYFGNTDAHFHALVGDGKHGRAERIQTFRGPACRTTFTRPSQHPVVPSENAFPCRVAVVLSRLSEGLDPISRPRGSQGSRQATITSLFDSRGLARSETARALFLPSVAPTHPAGRTANTAALRQQGAVVVAGHRSLHQASASALSGSTHPTCSAWRHPLPATPLGPGLHPALHQ